MADRLFKIAKELNVGVATIVDFLATKGHIIENKPTSMISEEVHDLLLKEFRSSMAEKEKADKIVIGTRPGGEHKHADDKPVAKPLFSIPKFGAEKTTSVPAPPPVTPEPPKQEETKLPEPAPEVAVVPADIQQEPNTQDEPCLVIEAPKQEESKLPESALEVVVVPADIQQEPNTQDEPRLVIEAPKQEESTDVSLLPAYLAGMLVAMVSGVAAIGLVKRLTSKGRFGAFSYYCWGAGALTMILSLIF